MLNKKIRPSDSARIEEKAINLLVKLATKPIKSDCSTSKQWSTNNDLSVSLGSSGLSLPLGNFGLIGAQKKVITDAVNAAKGNSSTNMFTDEVNQVRKLRGAK
ncbi:MAG: hypothetical protein ABI597_00325 [Gammaproteobacteria bacterium]